MGTDVPGERPQLFLDHPGGAEAPARRRRHHQYVLDQRTAREQDADRLRRDEGRHPRLHLLTGPGTAGPRHPREQRRPGPVWTPLIPATFDPDRVSSFGQQVPMGRAAHPDEIAPSYVFFAAERLSSYYTGEVLAAIGGETLPG